MIVCIILVTPVILLRKLVPLLEALEKSVDGVSFLQKLIQILNEHLASLINLLFNVAIIPTAVSVVTQLDDNKTIAKYQVSVMNRLFFFLVIIAIFLPLVGQTVILSFIEDLTNKTIESWPEYLGKNLVNGFGFMTYTIQAGFISNGMLLLDIGHQLMLRIKMFQHKQAQMDSLNKKPFVDDMPFDLGERSA